MKEHVSNIFFLYIVLTRLGVEPSKEVENDNLLDQHEERTTFYDFVLSMMTLYL